MRTRNYFLGLLSIVMTGCVEDFVPATTSEETVITRASIKEDQVFYWYGIDNEKIFLNQKKDKIYVKFTKETTKEQFKTVVADANISTRSAKSNFEESFVEGAFFNTALLEGAALSADDLKSFKAKKEIASATYMLESDRGSQIAYTDEFIVKLKDGTSYAQLQKLADKTNSKIGAEDEFVSGQYMLYVSKSSKLDAMQMANLFYETGLFEFAEPNFIWLNAELSNDFHFNDQWGLKNTGQSGGTIGADINIEQAWTVTKGSPNIRIAVVDDGVDLTHPDLQANIVPGSGYTTTGPGTGGAPYYATDNHGTMVAGVIAAVQNTIGISGVAPNCKIVSVKASTADDKMSTDCVAYGINWVVSNNAAEVINLSFGIDIPLTNVANAINNALNNGRRGKGCVVVAASGNVGQYSPVYFPANMSGVIAVGATTREGWGRSDSNYGSGGVDVLAPGTEIYSTDRQGVNGWNKSPGVSGNYVTAEHSFGQTSAAAAHVSGVAALILSMYPDISQDDVYDAIIRSGKIYPNRNYMTGYGMVNAHKALFTTASITLSNTGYGVHPVINSCANSTATLANLQNATSSNYYSITWRGSPGIQIVSGQGTKTLSFRKKAGSNEQISYVYADIFIASGNGSYNGSYTISSRPMTSPPTAVTSISIMNPNPGMNFQLVANPTDSNWSNSYEWRSSDPSRAMLSSSGGLGNYEQYVNCTEPGNYYIECRIVTPCGAGPWVGIGINAY